MMHPFFVEDYDMANNINGESNVTDGLTRKHPARAEREMVGHTQ